VGDTLWLVYSDNSEPAITRGGFRVYIAKVIVSEDHFSLEDIECLSHFEGENPNIREKNWVPFDYQNHLLLAYSLTPHQILSPIFNTGECQTIANSCAPIDWRWGLLRGGTPAILDESGEYIAFFHSSIDMATVHSKGKIAAHYLMGAYTFSAHPPFNITRISPEPIIGKGFYHGASYQPFWKPVQVVFPCGILLNEDDIWITYGRQDHEIHIAKIDKKGLLNSLKRVSSNIYQGD
jgi:hypothetical protein